MHSPFNATRVQTTLGGANFIIETGRLANQAHGAVWVQSGDTVVLVTATTQKSAGERDFFPLTVDYQEKMYAAGRIPGSFFRREIGRPGELETLTSRLIDRPIRPLFPKGFMDEVQILATVLSSDPDNIPDVLALTGASAALHLSKIPFFGPIAGARVGRVDGEFVLNPGYELLGKSTMDLIVAGSREAVVMVEGSAQFLPEELVAEALEWTHRQIQPLLDIQDELREKAGKEKMEVEPPKIDEALKAKVFDMARPGLEKALFIPVKAERRQAKKDVLEDVLTKLIEDEVYAEDPNDSLKQVPDFMDELTKEIVRGRIKTQGVRIDGRDTKTVRPIKIELGLLPRVHGSSLFARGETSVLVIATLGSGSDEQRVDTLAGDNTKRFMLHYNFPPFSVGEVKMVRVSRREIGHGALAERAIAPILPPAEDFPYTLRVVSEVMESNGSSSMASVCGASLALMDAGVPVKAPVAGIAMGLIKDGDDYLVLTDILGDEDALGDMDFKIAGTAEGVTAVQMDIKISGLPTAVMARALAQAREARLHILGEMAKVISTPRSELSPYAPQMEIVFIDPDKIRSEIGPGGKMIKHITATTGASIDIEDSGKIMIFAPNEQALAQAKDMVLFFDQKPEVGKNYKGKVVKTIDCGAIVEILPGVEGLVHISQQAPGREEQVPDVAKLGEELAVKVLEISPEGRIRLSHAAVVFEERGEEAPEGFFDNKRPGGGARKPGGDRGGRPGERGGRPGDRGGRPGGRGGDRGGRGGDR